jgi:hypothetical protein
MLWSSPFFTLPLDKTAEEGLFSAEIATIEKEGLDYR